MFIDLRERGVGGERERNIDVKIEISIGCFPYTLQPGIEPIT